MKYLSMPPFQLSGLLQEVNRQFFHPRGLALAVSTGDGANPGEFVIDGLLDGRHNPEGTLFAWDQFDTEAVLLRALEAERMLERGLAVRQSLGCDERGVQPLPL